MSSQQRVISAKAPVYGWLQAMYEAFMGHVPHWYKLTIIGFLIANPIILLAHGPFIAGWIILIQFIFTLALSLRCYPLMPGGLLALEAMFLGLATPEMFYDEIIHGLPVILLIMFMVAAVYFLRDFLYVILTQTLLGIKSRVLRAFSVCAIIAVLSAFLDALTVLAVLLTATLGFYQVYHKVASSITEDADDVHGRAELEDFRAFLRSMMMHAAVGTAIGGVPTLVGEPENIVIGTVAEWGFVEFFLQAAPVSMPTLIVGLLTCVLLERFRVFGFGRNLPSGVRTILEEHDAKIRAGWSRKDWVRIIAQGVAFALLVAALALQLAEVGLIGLGLLVLGTAINGVSDEHGVAKSFEHGMPFVGLITVFFAIVAMIHMQDLFRPVIQWVLTLEGDFQIVMIYLTNGMLSLVSDNVFVATIYIDQVHNALSSGLISRELFDKMAVAVVMGTGIPAMGTPNGQAAFLFLLTSALGHEIRLSYGRMVWMALPYVITTSTAALVSFVVFY